MAKEVKPIPEGYHTITPDLVLNDANGAIEFYKKAFGAQEVFRMNFANGKVVHAEIKIGDSVLMLADEMSGGKCLSPKSLGGSSVKIFLYVEDVDRIFKQAIEAGAKVEMPVADMFWGDRLGSLIDPFGHFWMLATHKEDVSPDELRRRGQEEMAKWDKECEKGWEKQ
jgi:PhnB protein